MGYYCRFDLELSPRFFVIFDTGEGVVGNVILERLPLPVL